MILSMVKPKHLNSLITCFLNSEVLKTVPAVTNRRSIYLTKALTSNQKKYKTEGYVETQREEYPDEKNLGTIVGLDPGEVEELDNEMLKKSDRKNVRTRGILKLHREKNWNNSETIELDSEEIDERIFEKSDKTKLKIRGNMKMQKKKNSGPKNLGTIFGLDSEEVEEIDEDKGKKSKGRHIVTEESKDVDGLNEEDNEQNYSQSSPMLREKLLRNIEENSNLFRLVITSLKCKRQRKKNGEIMLEGKRLIHDAICAGLLPKIIFYSNMASITGLNLPEKVLKTNVQLRRLRYKDFQLWGDVVTSQGVFAVFKRPDLKSENSKCIPLIVICDNVRDPGNMGSILRTVTAVGCEKLILTKGCVDIWESKVLRSAAGAHFRCPLIKEEVLWSDIENEVPAESKIVLADNELQGNKEETKSPNPFSVRSEIVDNIPLCSYDVVDYTQQRTVVVIGGETLGLSPEAQEFAAQRKGIRVFIPMSNNLESLNNGIACAILTYEIRRQIISNKASTEETDSLQEEKLDTE